MLGVYDTARFPALLFFGFAVAAPLAEVVLFRGFLYGCLSLVRRSQ